MKRILIIMSMVAIMFAQDSAEGNWKLSGLRVDYFDIAREPVSVIVSDHYGFGISLSIADIPAGVLFNHTINGPFTNEQLAGAGVNLNVNLYPDGSGEIGEGSYYPDVDIGTNADGSSDCITTGQIYPITDQFNWETDEGQEGNTFPYVNILGLPSANAWAGQTAYGLGVNGSGVFDNWQSEAIQIPTPSVLPGIFLSDGTILSYPAAYGGVTAGAWGGYFRAGDLGESQVPGQSGAANAVKFLLEWSAIDGWESESGLGDDLTIDEDGDGTDYDRIFGIPYVSSTYVDYTNPLCDITGGALTGAGPGLTYPIAGDIVAQLGGEAAVGALVTGSCLEATAATVNGYCLGAGGPTEFIYGSCLGQVQDGVEAQCDAAGSPQDAVTGLCYEASQSDDFAGACAYYGAATALTLTCLQLGFSEEICAAAAAEGIAGVENYCLYATGGFTCEQAGIDQCTVLTNPEFAITLCTTLAYSLTESETCAEWADSFDDDFLNETATQVIGATCSDYAYSLTGSPLGAIADGCFYATGGAEPYYSGCVEEQTAAACDAFATAGADEFFAQQTGLTCTQYGASYVGMCVTQVAGANTFYVMDPSLTAWGMFLTYNAVSVQQYLAGGCDLTCIATYYPDLLVNDSASDFDPSCYYTGETCGGRLLMDFAPTCVAEVEAHQIVAEFVDLEALECEGTGDVAGGYDDLNGNGEWDEEFEGPAGDGIVNVVDVVKLVGHILGQTPLGGFLLCEGDLNHDGIVNVVDVVAIVNIILGSGLNSNAGATEATIEYTHNSIMINGNGAIGAADLLVTLNNVVSINDITISNDFLGDFQIIDENTVRILVTDLSLDLRGEFVTITNNTIDAVTAYEGSGVVSSDAKMLSMGNVRFEDANNTLPLAYEIKDAYPNPFNPSTNLEMTLNVKSDVSIKVYNLTGQLVDVIAEGTFSPSSYKFTWNAENLASGIYFISTKVGNDLKQQKVMLIK